MRSRLTVVPIVLVGALLLSPSSALAQAASSGGGELGGDDQYASGQLLGEDSAEVVAQEGRDLGPEDQPRAGGGNVTCRWYGMDPETEAPSGPVDWQRLRHPPEHLVGLEVEVLRVCDDGTGTYADADIVTLVLPTGQPPAVDPRRLAAMARARLPLPLPEARTSPPGDQTVHLATWLWVDNWRPQSRTASAGGVTATVTANPVEQRWSFGSPAERALCLDAGRPYDLSRPPHEQSTTCSYTFRRSSAGQPDEAFPVTATVVWRITWTSNVGAGGDLGRVARTVVIPTRVAEHQALIVRTRP